MKIKQVMLNKSVATNDNKESCLQYCNGFITNGEWVLREDLINTGKFSIKETKFWTDALNKKFSNHEKDYIIHVDVTKAITDLKSSKGLQIVKFILQDECGENYNYFIQQKYYEKLILSLAKNKGILFETSCPRTQKDIENSDDFAYANHMIIKLNGEFVGVIMPVAINEEALN